MGKGEDAVCPKDAKKKQQGKAQVSRWRAEVEGGLRWGRRCNGTTAGREDLKGGARWKKREKWA